MKKTVSMLWSFSSPTVHIVNFLMVHGSWRNLHTRFWNQSEVDARNAIVSSDGREPAILRFRYSALPTQSRRPFATSLFGLTVAQLVERCARIAGPLVGVPPEGVQLYFSQCMVLFPCPRICMVIISCFYEQPVRNTSFNSISVRIWLR